MTDRQTITFRRVLYQRERYAYIVSAEHIRGEIQKEVGENAVVGTPDPVVRIDYNTNTVYVDFVAPVFLNVKPEHRKTVKSVVDKSTMVEALEMVNDD